jgi:hypothetical protein
MCRRDAPAVGAGRSALAGLRPAITKTVRCSGLGGRVGPFLGSGRKKSPKRHGGPFRRTVFVVVIVIVVVVVVVVVVVAGGMGPVATTIGIERTGMGRSAPVGDRSATDGAASRHALRSGLGEQPPPRVPARPTGRSDRQNGPLLDPPASRSDHVCGQSAKTVRPTARARSRGAFSRCRDAQDEAARVGPGQCANPPGAPVRVGLNPDLIGRTAQPARRAPNVGTLPRSWTEPPKC